ncbi:MAG TPA: hypothetical protein VFV42_12175 [Acidimicrobiales bacterium]|nr:hypothetical protein [Acidimicrobiales bacterium]
MEVEPGVSILVVCTGNICRSPLAAALLASRADAAGAEVDITSAGFVTADRPSPPEIVELMAARGLDGSAHRSRRIDAGELRTHDLILCMERAHVREVAVLDREAFERTFTLPELARRAQAHGPRRDLEDVRLYLRRIGADRRPVDVLGADEGDEVADPYGRSAAAYRRAADEIDRLLDVVVPLLFPSRS